MIKPDLGVFLGNTALDEKTNWQTMFKLDQMRLLEPPSGVVVLEMTARDEGDGVDEDVWADKLLR